MSFTVDSVDNVNTKQMARERKKIIIYDTTDTRKKEYEREREKKQFIQTKLSNYLSTFNH